MDKTYCIDDGKKMVHFSLEQLMRLHPRERRIIELRFGLNGNNIHTFKAIGDKIQSMVNPDKTLSPTMARQIWKRALKKLRNKHISDMEI